MARWTPSKSRPLALALAVLMSPMASLAQRTDSKSAKKPDPDELRARALYKEGQTAYDVGQFAKALELYTEAYKVKPLPGFLFNIAQCHRQLGDYKQAGFFFGRFIDNSKPEAANVELARELLQDANRRQQAAEDAKAMEDKRRADEAAAAAAKAAADAPLATNLEPSSSGLTLPPPPPPPVDDTPAYKKGWFWGVVVGGAAVLAGGTVAVVLANKTRIVPYTPTVTTLPDVDARSAK